VLDLYISTVRSEMASAHIISCCLLYRHTLPTFLLR